MEEHLNNKKPVIFVFIIMILIFLFLYKGLIEKGDIYEIKYNEYISELKNEKGQNQKTLKKNKSNDKNNNEFNKIKIPPELLSMDNSLLEAKSLLSGMKEKNERIIGNVNRFMINSHNYTNDQLSSFLGNIIYDIKIIQNGIDTVDKNLEDVTNEIDLLRHK